MQSAPSLPALSLLLRGAALLVVWWALTLGETTALGFGLGVTAPFHQAHVFVSRQTG